MISEKDERPNGSDCKVVIKRPFLTRGSGKAGGIGDKIDPKAKSLTPRDLD